ncbi:MAG: phage terminase small subunit-related protein [Bacteroidales bacterium]|jgi:uncharacterized protein YjcR|nr:phage terminase small subunit-related protein [Bacteroidales bacterium]
MSDISNKKKREIAERMFIDQGATGKAIAEQLEVSEQTVSRWKKDHNWDDRRRQTLTAPHKIKEILLEELENVANGQKAKIDADALAKINKVIDTLTDKVSVQVVITVFKEFDNWMADQEPDVAISFLEWHKQFILHKATQESSSC